MIHAQYSKIGIIIYYNENYYNIKEIKMVVFKGGSYLREYMK